MKVNFQLINEFTVALRNSTEKELLNSVEIYTLDELSLLYKGRFYGLHFSALGKDFVINSKFELFAVDDFDPNITISIDDSRIVKLIEEFLFWRLKALKALTI